MQSLVDLAYKYRQHAVRVSPANATLAKKGEAKKREVAMKFYNDAAEAVLALNLRR